MKRNAPAASMSTSDENNICPSKAKVENFLKEYELTISSQLTSDQYDETARLSYDFRTVFVRNLLELKQLKIPPYKIALKSD